MGNENDWEIFAITIWPELPILDKKMMEKKGKMESVLERWIAEGGTTKQLFETLKKIKRMDVLIALEEDFPFVR